MSKDKNNRVDRVGPGVSLGEVVRDFTESWDASPATSVAHDLNSFAASVAGSPRKHVGGCTHITDGLCVPGCETDGELRKRLQDRFG